MTPNQLIEKKQEDNESSDIFVRRQAEESLDSWFIHLEKQGKSRNTCVQRFYAVCSFYKQNYLELEVEDAPST